MMISFRGLLLLLLSREFFIFQIADVHLLDSATWWRLLGQKYFLPAEVTGMKLFGTDPVQRRVIRFVIQMKSNSMNVKADGNRKQALKPLIRGRARLSRRAVRGRWE